jgi:DNA-binding NarL/FixJ family response regulator
MTIRVLIVDDHALIRQGLRRAFEHDESIEVVGEADSVAGALRAFQGLSPDVVLVDISLPDGDGLMLTRQLRHASRTVGIVVVTMHGDDEHLLGALDAGASSFVLKSAPAEEVVAAAHHAAVAPTTFSAVNLANAIKRRMNGDGIRLTQREGEVLGLLKDGLSVAQVSRRMYISESTAKTHISKLYSKLGASNRTQAIMAALKLGLIRQDSSGTRTGAVV